MYQPLRRPSSLLHALIALTLTISVAGADLPLDSSIDAFFSALGSPDSAPDLTVADVRAAIAADASLQAGGEHVTTPLMYVAGYNPDPEVTRALLAAGADVAVRDAHGWTALMFAAAFNPNPDVVRALLDHGAEMSASGEYEAVPFRSIPGHSPIVDFMRTLIETGDVDRPVRGGDAALLAAAAFNLNPEVVRVLTDAGAEVNTPVDGGGTALMAAAGLNPNPAVTRALTDAGADIPVPTTAGMP